MKNNMRLRLCHPAREICLLATIALLTPFTAFPQATDHTGELTRLLQENKFFPACRYYQTHHDSLRLEWQADSSVQEMETLYAYYIDKFLNRPDSAAAKMNRLLKEHPDFFEGTSTVIYFYNELLNLYYQTQDYDKELETYDEIERLIGQWAEADENWRLTQIQILAELRKAALQRKTAIPRPMRLVAPDSTTTVPLDTTGILNCTASYNGHPMRLWIDTGVSYALFMQEEKARKYGLKLFAHDSTLVNGILSPKAEAVIDTLRIGTFCLTDIPVIVLCHDITHGMPDSIRGKDVRHIVDSIYSMSDAVLGLPALCKLGQVTFDLSGHKLTLRAPRHPFTPSEEPNLYLNQNMLYTRCTLNGAEAVGLLDTGNTGNYLTFSHSFYETNKDRIPLDTLTAKRKIGSWIYGHTQADMPYEIPLQPDIRFDGLPVRIPPKADIIITPHDDASQSHLDVFFSLPFCRSLGDKITFDFQEMRLMGK